MKSYTTYLMTQLRLTMRDKTVLVFIPHTGTGMGVQF